MEKKFMERALELARKGIGRVNPNPMVGAVIVKDGTIIGEGWHGYYGGPHAEVVAVEDAKERAPEQLAGSTMYVTLEPCSHHGKTPPCTELIMDNGIRRVVIGMVDPNPLVSGGGIKQLTEQGVEVIMAECGDDCRKLNEAFVKYMTTGKPFVMHKVGMTLDGKIATHTGESKWITGEVAREEVHQLRHGYMGIMVGINTVLADDPSLTCRMEGGIHPVPIIIDSTLKTPVSAKAIMPRNLISDFYGHAIIVTTAKADLEKKRKLIEKGITIIEVSEKEGQVDLEEAMTKLGEKGIDSIILEGGGTLSFSALEAGLVDKIRYYIAPKLLGGGRAKSPMEGAGFSKLEDAAEIFDQTVWQCGNDIAVEGYIRRTS